MCVSRVFLTTRHFCFFFFQFNLWKSGSFTYYISINHISYRLHNTNKEPEVSTDIIYEWPDYLRVINCNKQGIFLHLQLNWAHNCSTEIQWLPEWWLCDKAPPGLLPRMIYLHEQCPRPFLLS